MTSTNLRKRPVNQESVSLGRYSPRLPSEVRSVCSLVRISAKAHCKWNNPTRHNAKLLIEELLQHWNSVHTTPPTDELTADLSTHLAKPFAYFCSRSKSEVLDPHFNIILDEPLDVNILLSHVLHERSLTPFVIDSLKRFHSLSDVMQVLSSCLDSPTVGDRTEHFLSAIEQMTKYTLLICTIESLSLESQRFLGNMIRKNDLPIPLAYYTCEQKKTEFKINFNPLSETFCFSDERVLLYLGSPSAVGLGKTSILQYLFENKRIGSLNTKGNPHVRAGCIDTMFASLAKNDPYAMFDVHGTMNTMNEDLITAIQQYCSVQILFVTEHDLGQEGFLSSTLNYSKETRDKPTIIVMFDPHYGDKNSSLSAQTFEKQFVNEQWPNAVCITAPIFSQPSAGSQFQDERRPKQLRQALLNAFQSLDTPIKAQPICKSIFSIQAYFLTVKSGNSTSPPPSYTFELQYTLDSLFGSLSDQTNNLEKVTPVSYLDSEKLKCETQLSQLWNESPADLQARLEHIDQQYRAIDRIPEHLTFFINLLINRPYIELLITEKYLEQWRAQFESHLCERMAAAKNAAMTAMSRIKHGEEAYQQHVQKKNQAEMENMQNQLQQMEEEYKNHQESLVEIENQLANIDLTIGLFCDEILAFYEYLPALFERNNLAEQLAQETHGAHVQRLRVPHSTRSPTPMPQQVNGRVPKACAALGQENTLSINCHR